MNGKRSLSRDDSKKAYETSWLLQLGPTLQEGASMKQKPAITSLFSARLLRAVCSRLSITVVLIYCSKNRGTNLISAARVGSAVTHFRIVWLLVIVLLANEQLA